MEQKKHNSGYNRTISCQWFFSRTSFFYNWLLLVSNDSENISQTYTLFSPFFITNFNRFFQKNPLKLRIKKKSPEGDCDDLASMQEKFCILTTPSVVFVFPPRKRCVKQP